MINPTKEAVDIAYSTLANMNTGIGQSFPGFDIVMCSVAKALDAFAAQQRAPADEQLTRLNRILDTHEKMMHPWYGPCDGFGPDEQCAECLRVLGRDPIAAPPDGALERAREAYEIALRTATAGMGKYMSAQVRASIMPQVKDAMIAAILAAEARNFMTPSPARENERSIPVGS